MGDEGDWDRSAGLACGLRYSSVCEMQREDAESENILKSAAAIPKHCTCVATKTGVPCVV
jgi:hypothetical protein